MTPEKKIKGRRRHIGTDTTGVRVGLEVHSAGVQDRDGAPDVLKALAARYPMLRHVFADVRLCGPQTARRPEGHQTLDCADRQALRYGAGL
jgi:hypothetical protein